MAPERRRPAAGNSLIARGVRTPGGNFIAKDTQTRQQVLGLVAAGGVKVRC